MIVHPGSTVSHFNSGRYERLCLSVHPLVCWSIGNTMLFWRIQVVIALLFLPKCLVIFFISAPAHLHATLVIVYTALSKVDDSIFFIDSF